MTAAAFLAADAQLFGAFGVAADWRAGGAGAATSCTVIRERPSVDAAGFGTAMRADAQVVSVRKTEIAAVAKNDTFTIGAEVLTVRSVRQDSQSLMWIAEC